MDGRENAIVVHPDFRMVVLANRPGFPFLGNDFFGTLGKARAVMTASIVSTTVLCCPLLLTMRCLCPSHMGAGSFTNHGSYFSEIT